MIRVDEAHRGVLQSFLANDPCRAMFPLANLAAHGLSGRGHPHATAFWIDDADAPTAVLGITEEGVLMPLWADGFDARRALPPVAGRRPIGLAGPARAVRELMAVAGFAAPPGQRDSDEPHFMLDLARLRVPEGPGRLAPLDAAPDVARAWRTAYVAKLNKREPEQDRVAAEVAGWIETGSHVFLIVDGRPAALTGFNARLPGIVQVGGVYVPLETRGRGLARRAVGLHLATAREAGVARATLFASSPAAASCYTALGFERIGDYALVFLAEPLA